MTDPGSSDSEKVTALSAMYQSEISANIGELQATTAIVLGLLTYLAATLFLFGQLKPSVLPLLPLGVIFACAYQMLRAAVVVRRAAVARTYELRLAEVVGFKELVEEAKLGSPFYGSIDDLGLIVTRRESRWPLKAAVAVMAYFGLYGLSILYTVLVMADRWSRPDGSNWTSLWWSLGYAVLWIGLLAAAFYLFRTEKPAELPAW